MSKLKTTAVLSTFLLSLPLLAQAATIERQEVRMSADVCQPALPAFDGAFRKRPLAMQNEGTAAAFVTCAFGGTFNGVPSAKTLTVGFTNTTSAPIQVNCTLVDAHAGVLDPTYYPKSINVPPAGSPVALLIWSAISDNNGVKFTYPAASCSLPPGTGVQVTNHTYDEEIGA
jgi:hypothetical protein